MYWDTGIDDTGTSLSVTPCQRCTFNNIEIPGYFALDGIGDTSVEHRGVDRYFSSDNVLRFSVGEDVLSPIGIRAINDGSTIS